MNNGEVYVCDALSPLFLFHFVSLSVYLLGGVKKNQTNIDEIVKKKFLRKQIKKISTFSKKITFSIPNPNLKKLNFSNVFNFV